MPLTSDGHICPRLLLPPGWYEHGDVCVAPLQEPVHCQEDPPAGEDLLVPMAGGERRAGSACCLLDLHRRGAGCPPAPALAGGPAPVFPAGSHTGCDGQTWGFFFFPEVPSPDRQRGDAQESGSTCSPRGGGSGRLRHIWGWGKGAGTTGTQMSTGGLTHHPSLAARQGCGWGLGRRNQIALD